MLSFVDLKEKYPNYSIIKYNKQTIRDSRENRQKMGNKFAKIVFGTD